MRNSLVVLLLACAVGCRSTVLPSMPAFGAGTESLVAAAHELNGAFAVRDAVKIEALLAPDYSFNYVDEGMRGSLQATPNAPRGRWLEKVFQNLSSGPLSSAVVDARVVRNVGVTVTAYQWQGAWTGTSFSYSGYITDVWIRDGDRWRVLSSSAVLMPRS